LRDRAAAPGALRPHRGRPRLGPDALPGSHGALHVDDPRRRPRDRHPAGGNGRPGRARRHTRLRGGPRYGRGGAPVSTGGAAGSTDSTTRGMERREAVVQVARRLFGERGYAAVTIREVAAQAGVSPALVMKIAGSKEQLYAMATPAEPAPLLPEDRKSVV